MSTKQQIIRIMLAVFLAVPLARAEGEAERNAPSVSSRRAQPKPPIYHRRTTLPPGWFKQGGSPGALTDTQVSEARPVVHFDTTGEPSSGQSGVAQRMRQIREAQVFDDLPTTAPAASPPATGPSSRRNPDPAAPAALGNTPSMNTQPPAAASPGAAIPGAGTSTVPGALPTAVNPPGPLAGATPSPVTQSPVTTDDQIAQPPVESAVDSRAITETPAVNAEAGQTESLAKPAGDSLPSVMKRTRLRQDMSGETTTELSPQDGLTHAPDTESADTEATPLVATPMANLGSEATDEAADDASAVLIKNESPILEVVTRGPKTMVVGKTATYVVDLQNHSEVAAKDVVVRLNIPQWVEIVQQSPTLGAAHIQPDDSGNAELAWTVDRLNAGGQEKLTIDLIPRGSRPLDLGVTWTFSPAQSVTQIQVQEPKLHLHVVGPQDVLYGDTKVYSITISNPGTGDAENVVLNLLPLLQGERSAGVRNLGTITAGGRRTIEVELTTRQTGRLQVRAEATADGGLAAQGQQEVIVRRAALEAQVEGPPMKYAGTRAHYVIRVANTGDAPAGDVVAVATLPAGAREVASSDGGSLDPNTGQVQWHAGELRPGASRVFEMECTLMAPGDNRVDLRTVATGDVNAVGSAVTQVESLADLKLSVNDPQGAVAVGADVIYEVRITNRGTKEAENIELFGYFSEGVEPIAVAGWRGQLNEGEVVMQAIPRLGAGQEMLIRITAKGGRAGDHVFRAELECNAPETKLAVEEWTRFYGEPTTEPEVPQQADRRPTPGPSTPVKPLKMQRY